MKIDLKVIPELNEEIVSIRVRELTPRRQLLISELGSLDQNIIIGYQGQDITVLSEDEIVLFSTRDKKVVAKTEAGTEYIIKQRLYELEEALAPKGFIRISSGVLGSAKKIRKLHMTLSGSICVVFTDGTKEFASRRCVGAIKQYLGI